MKTLKESLLDDEDVLLKNTGDEVIIKKFLKDNYKIAGNYNIKNGIVNTNGFITVKPNSKNIKSLTNNLFKFGKCKDFDCKYCHKLQSLEGAPKECEIFSCRGCDNLITLEGAPEKCISFDCSYCHKLQSLEGAPEKCETFECYNCDNLTSLKGAPEECQVFDCGYCINLTSLKGAPKKCEEFYCDNKFSKGNAKNL